MAIEHLYRALKAEPGSKILPLVGNLTDPSPGLGWRHRERQTLEERSRPDLILALALIHHLAIGRNVPLPELVAWFASFEADVVIEFVVPEDAMVKQLLRNRDELDFGYTQDCFEAAAAEHFVIAETERLQSGTRTISFLFDGANEPLGIGIAIGTARWKTHGADAAAPENLLEVIGVQRVAVVKQIP